MLQFWFPKEEFYTHLQPMMGYSEFCRNAILKEIQLVNSDQYIDSEIQKYKTIIQELQDHKKEVKKASKVDNSKVKEILQGGYESFKQNNRMMTEDHFNWNWIEDKIIKKLPKGCKLDKKEVLEIYQDHYREGKVLINV